MSLTDNTVMPVIPVPAPYNVPVPFGGVPQGGIAV